MGFEKLEPFGDQIQNYQLALLASIMLNAIPRSAKTKRKTYKPENFVVGDISYLFGLPKKQSMEEMKQVLMSIAKVVTKKKRKKKKKGKK